MDYTSKFLSFQLALFANRIDHYIFLQRNGTQFIAGIPVYSYQAGDARLLGFEATADIHPFHSLHIGNTFSLVDAVQLHQPAESKYLPMTPAPRWNTEIKYELTHDGHRFNNAFVALEVECNLRQTHYLKASDTETPTPSYTLVNINAGTDLNNSQGKRIASLYLSVENLFDRAYQNHLSRLKYMDVNNLTLRQGIYNPGRNIALRLIVPLSL